MKKAAAEEDDEQHEQKHSMRSSVPGFIYINNLFYLCEFCLIFIRDYEKLYRLKVLGCKSFVGESHRYTSWLVI